jgi:hypothetical protein
MDAMSASFSSCGGVASRSTRVCLGSFAVGPWSLASATGRHHEAGRQSRPHHSVGPVCSSPLPEMRPGAISVGMLVIRCRPPEKQLASSHAAFHLRGVLAQHPEIRPASARRHKQD